MEFDEQVFPAVGAPIDKTWSAVLTEESGETREITWSPTLVTTAADSTRACRQVNESDGPVSREAQAQELEH